MTFLPSDGSISSLYERCEVSLDKLQASINNLSSETLDGLESQRCSDEIGRLSIWADEVGAKGGYLDYTLRKSSRLQNRVIELLKELENVVFCGGKLGILCLLTLLTLTSNFESGSYRRLEK